MRRRRASTEKVRRHRYGPAVLEPFIPPPPPGSNVWTFPKDLDNAVWLDSMVTVTPNVIATTFGVVDGDKVVEDGGTGQHTLARDAPQALTGQPQTVVFYVKAAERKVLGIRSTDKAGATQLSHLDLATGLAAPHAQHTMTIQNLGGGWFWGKVTLNTAGAGAVPPRWDFHPLAVAGQLVYTGTPGSGLYLWNLQYFPNQAGLSLVSEYSALGIGIPFGPFNLFSNASGAPLANGFTTTLLFVDPATIVGAIANMRARGFQAILLMTGGGHTQYTSPTGPGGAQEFDFNKWKARMDLFNTATIKNAVRDGVADGCVVGADTMDEPEHPSWGGTVTKAVCDQMATYVKSIFPTLPAGQNFGNYPAFRTTERFLVNDFVIAQTFRQAVTPTAYRDSVLAMAALDKVSACFGINLFADPESGDLVQLSVAKIASWGAVLGPAGCGLELWKYDPTIWADQAKVDAMTTIANSLLTQPKKSWRRLP